RTYVRLSARGASSPAISPALPPSDQQASSIRVGVPMVQSLEDARRRSPSGGGGGPRVPPHNLEDAESLLGAMLLSRDAIVSAVELQLGPDDFYRPAHGHIFDAITSIYGQGEPADPVTVAEELRRAGLLDAVGGPAGIVAL